MLFKEVVAQITTQDDRQVVDIIHVVDTDKRQLLVEMPTGNLTSNDVPKIGIDGFIKQASGVELRYDGEPAVLGRDIALDVITGFESRFALFFQVEVDLTVERGAYAVFGEIRMVEVIVTERHIRRDQKVSLKIGQGNNGRVDGVVAEVGGGGLIKRGIGERGTNGGVDVQQMELRHVSADLVLFIMEIGVIVVGSQVLVVFASIIVCHTEIGQIDASIGARDIEFRIVAELTAEVEFESGEAFLVEAYLEQQAGTLLGVVTKSEAEDMWVCRLEVHRQGVGFLNFPIDGV